MDIRYYRVERENTEKVRIDFDKNKSYLKTKDGEIIIPDHSSLTADATLQDHQITKKEYETDEA